MITNSNAGLQRIMNALNKMTEDYGLRINVENTVVMRIGKHAVKYMKINSDGKLEIT